jgi:hemerythrin
LENAVESPYKRFEIGIAEIDAQHRRLFEMLDEMQKWSGSELKHRAIPDILSALADYASTHFLVEESVMRMLHYPGTAAHIADHKKFTNRLNVFRHQLLKEGRVGDIDLVGFIQTWLVEHINRADRAYVDYFLAKGINPHPFP